MQTRTVTKRPRAVALALAVATCVFAPAAKAGYMLTTLVTDDQTFLTSQGFAPAANVDSRLINPWGVSFSATGPFWVSNQATGTSTLYNSSGAPQALVVTIPGSANGPSGPTGQAFSGSATDFRLSNNNPGRFFFANLNGSISGWNGGTAAQVVATGAQGSVYTGLAIGAAGNQNRLFAANNALGRIDVFGSDFTAVSAPGAFVDPNLPAGFSPFNITNIGGELYVTYASGGANADEAAEGQGVVDVFSTTGAFLRRIASPGGATTSPWGVALAPQSFGELAGALLVGNFSDSLGFINAFNPTTGDFLGRLKLADGTDFNVTYLWALVFGNGGAGGLANQLYFTAGIGDEQHGLFATLIPTPLPAAAPLFAMGVAAAAGALGRRRKRPV